jgi:hypothetical protein
MSSKEQTHAKDKTGSKQRGPKPASENLDILAQQQPQPGAIIQRTRLDPNSLTARDVQQLQRSVGNRAVGRLLDHPPQEVIQRQVDTSPSPFLPQYEKDEVPGWKDEGGVAEWAKEEYKRESKRTVICSMTEDRKIGSVYFGEEGRIRTTHGAGPEKEKHEGKTTVQFNIDESKAIPAFETANPKLVGSKKYWSYFDQWLAQTLQNVTVDNAPAWATLVESPETAYDLQKGSPPENLKLFEIFKNINGQVESWHPSRGTATKFDTDKQTISVLNAAINHINTKGLTDPGARNTAFYEFVESRLPSFVGYMRRPEEVG